MAKIISFYAFSRGAGKSFLAANVAALLASAGRKMGLVDADLLSPTLSLLLGLGDDPDKKYVNNYLVGQCAIDQATFDVTPPVGLDGCLRLVPANADTAEVLRVLRSGYDAIRLQDGIQVLAEKVRLDALILDTHAGLDQDTLKSLMLPDVLAIALRMDKQDYTGTAVLIELARRLNVPRIALIVNQVADVYDTEQVRAEVEKTYGASVAGVLPYSEDVAAFASAGTGLFVLCYPDHRVTLALKQLAARLMA